MLRFRFSEFLDKLILFGTMLGFLLVGISSIRSSRNLDTISRQGLSPLLESKVDVQNYVASDARLKKVAWGSPVSQSRGENWVYDLFTPPVIYYNPADRIFDVTPPVVIAEDDGSDLWKAFGLELIEVRRRPYRLQLVGYVGEEGNYMACLKYLPTGELLYAKSGKTLVEAGVRVVSFAVSQSEVSREGSMPVYQKVGQARLLDYETGDEILLTNVETKMFSELEARVRSKDEGREYLVREGSQIEIEGEYYIIGALSDSPDEAMVTKVSVDGAKRLSKLLTPSIRRGSSERGSNEEETTRSPFAIRPQPPLKKPES